MSDRLREVFRLHSVFRNAPFTEEALLADVLHPLDAEADWTRQGTYLWYWAIGRALRPTSVLEIGTRFGYSLASLVKGSERVSRVVSYDMELDHVGSIDYVEDYLRKQHTKIAVRSVRVDTRTLDALPAVDGPIDLAHVDADHSEEGCYHDCTLAFAVLCDGGWLVIDDVGAAEGDPRARRGADRFLREHGLAPIFVDAYRGMYLAEKTTTVLGAS
jgi:predicted O-methyltransferase YrrM